MSLANISLIDLNKSGSAPLGGINTHEGSKLGDIFLNLLKDLKSSKNINEQIANGHSAKDAEETEILAKFIAKFNSSKVFDQSNLILDEKNEFEGLEDLISAFKTQAENNNSFVVSHENSVEEQNKNVQAFLSLVADFTKQVTKKDEGEIYLEPGLGDTNQEGIEAKPLELPHHLRTPNAAYPNDKQQFSFSTSNLPVQMHASIKDFEIIKPPTPLEKTIGTEGELNKINQIEETVNLPTYEVKAINLPFSREKAGGEPTNGVEGELSKINQIEETVNLPTYEVKSINRPFSRENAGGEPAKGGPILYKTSLGRGPLGAVATEEVSQNEPSNPLDKQGNTYEEKAVSSSKQEVKTLNIQNSTKELSNKGRSGTEHYSSSLKEKNVEYDADEIGLTSSKNLRGVEERRLVANGAVDYTKYKAFSDDAFRPVALASQKQKTTQKSQVPASFAVDEVVTSFGQAMNFIDGSKLAKNRPLENQVEELAVEPFTPRSLIAQPPNSTLTGSNSHSLETLEKWVDSQLDLNSRGWVSNLSKSMLSAVNRGHQRLTFTLSPESLGKVNVSFTQGINGLDIRISAERQATASLIGDAEAKLVLNIEAAGQRVASVTCSSSNSFENAYHSSQNSSSDTNRGNSDDNRKSKTGEPDQSSENANSAETVGKSNDDDTIINITI